MIPDFWKYLDLKKKTCPGLLRRLSSLLRCLRRTEARAWSTLLSRFSTLQTVRVLEKQNSYNCSANCLSVRKTQFYCVLAGSRFYSAKCFIVVSALNYSLDFTLQRGNISQWSPCNAHVHKELPNTTLQQCEPRRNNCSYNCWFVRIQKAKTDNAFAHVLQIIQSNFANLRPFPFEFVWHHYWV